MSTIREQIVVAAITALNTGTPGGVPAAERTRSAGIGATNLPSICVYPVRDLVEDVHGKATPLVRARLTLNVECRAAGTAADRPDKAVDPLLAWVVAALGHKQLDDGSGGKLNHDITLISTEFDYDQGETPFVKATVEFQVEYQHLANDAERRN